MQVFLPHDPWFFQIDNGDIRACARFQRTGIQAEYFAGAVESTSTSRRSGILSL